MPDRTPTKGELLSSLSHALDLVEGQPEGHAVRTTLLAMETGRRFGLAQADLDHLFYACLLKDAGCSNNSARIYKIFGGDEILCKNKVKFTDWSQPIESLRFGIQHTERGGSLIQKLRRMASNLAPPKQIMAEVTRARCTRGAHIALKLGFGQVVSDAILHLDEHWDGMGAPSEVKGHDIPVLSRIVCLAQTMEVFATTFGKNAAYEMLRERQGRWFQPELSRVMASLEADNGFWERAAKASFYADLAHEAPEDEKVPVDAEVDRICEAYALIIDAKSSFTGGHSTRVTRYAVEIAEHLGFPADQIKTLRRAALLHDIGKLGVPNRILDKPGRLTDDEFDVIRLHPKHSYTILAPIKGFGEIAEIASRHHERLDGTGYWRGLSADKICPLTRCLTVADVLDALHAKRPYRDAMPMKRALAILDSDIGVAFDGDCVRAARELFGEEPEMQMAA